MKSSLAALCLSFTACLATPALAAPITVPNFSFENPGTGDYTNGNQNGVNPGIMADWNYSADFTSSSYGVQLSTASQFNPGQITGSQFGYLNSNDTLSSITSSTLATVSLSTNYTLIVALGKRLDAQGFTNAGQFGLNIIAGGAVVATRLVNGSTLTAGSLTDFSLTWNSGNTAPGDLSVQITWLNTINPGPSNLSQGPYDNVRFASAAAVPEPSSATAFALVFAAVFGLVWRRRTQRLSLGF